jgi:hypothetical protein
MIYKLLSVISRLVNKITTGGGGFTPASFPIYKILIKIAQIKDNICEIGCSTAHISFKLAKKGFTVTGVEILEDSAKRAQAKFDKARLNVKIHNCDIFDYTENHDIIWNSGLLQCIDDETRENLIAHISKLAKKAVFIVPVRKERLPAVSNKPAGVAGCTEYPTSIIPFQLSKYYNKVCVHTINKNKICLETDFIACVCDNNMIIRGDTSGN